MKYIDVTLLKEKTINDAAKTIYAHLHSNHCPLERSIPCKSFSLHSSIIYEPPCVHI
jgi:hypothetical protein